LINILQNTHDVLIISVILAWIIKFWESFQEINRLNYMINKHASRMKILMLNGPKKIAKVIQRHPT